MGWFGGSASSRSWGKNRAPLRRDFVASRKPQGRYDRAELEIPADLVNKPGRGYSLRDNVYGDDFGSKLVDVGIADIRTPYRAPLANSVAERVVRTLRQECLDHVIVLNERHLLALLTEFVCYYNHDRPHRTIELETPVPSPPISHGDVVSRPILGGLHHVYARAA